MSEELGPQFADYDTALPGMRVNHFQPHNGDLREAKPHEQTPEQFMNRPDVFVHGRMTTEPNRLPEWSDEDRLHAGTRQSAQQRIYDNGPPQGGAKPRYFYGSVDPERMANANLPGYHEASGSIPAHQRRAFSDTFPNGRKGDIGTGWDKLPGNIYYRNTEEDAGSTSVSLTHGWGQEGPLNFTSWREHVEGALARDEHVPHHVKAIYSAMEHAAKDRVVPDSVVDLAAEKMHRQMRFDPQGKHYSDNMVVPHGMITDHPALFGRGAEDPGNKHPSITQHATVPREDFRSLVHLAEQKAGNWGPRGDSPGYDSKPTILDLPNRPYPRIEDA